ncbi:MAG: glycosyltransferase [Fibromonadaceae bacterium]|jgi:glycosyltransferase involved in cell wall biosynthesis|nr:glycosyltransferase [Fibromonadaceae bacterium]
MPFGTLKKALPCVGKKNALSICMIVKNEEANIGRAIESFLPFADEIVVNDTGSTDRTIEIIKSFPKTVLIESEWINDFAYSRNLSVDKATCSWILWMDADDYVPPDQVESFKKLKLAALDKMISFTVCNTGEDGRPTGLRFMQARMFPNNPKIRFEGKVHENIIGPANIIGLHPINTEVIIWHTGYETLEIRQKKAKRNLELQLADPDHDKKIEGLIEFGDSYSVLNEIEKAIVYYRRAVEFKNCPAEQIELKMNAMNKLARLLSRTGEAKEAKEVYQKCLDQFPKNEEAYYGLAIHILSEGKMEESMSYFKKLLTMKAQVSIGGTNYFSIRQDCLKNLSVYEFKKENFKLSKYYAQEMLKNEPENKEAKWLIDQAELLIINAKDKRPLLSLCMIVKNEENNIGDCLKSVQGLADEIVITDTGSSDKTIEIAKSFGARIEHYEWTKDFSAARNYSFSKSACRWIIWLDADDRLPQKTVQELRKQLESEKIPCRVFSLVVCNSADEGKTGSRFSQIRVFPNKEQIKFEGRVHEQILPSIRKLGMPEISLPLEIFHTGYEDPATLKEKQLRNQDIFREQFPGEKGMNPLDMFHYGSSYEIIGDSENALKWLRESLNEAKRLHYNELLILLPHDIARILEKQGNLQGALEALEASLEKDSQFEPTLYRKARILSALGQREEAAKWFGYCASLISKESFLPTSTKSTNATALQFLSEYWKEAGLLTVAVDILKALKSLMLGEPHKPFALAEIYITHDKAKEAFDNLEFLKKDMESTPEFAFLNGQALALIGDVESAIKVVREAREKFPENSDLASLAKAMNLE